MTSAIEIRSSQLPPHWIVNGTFSGNALYTSLICARHLYVLKGLTGLKSRFGTFSTDYMESRLLHGKYSLYFNCVKENVLHPHMSASASSSYFKFEDIIRELTPLPSQNFDIKQTNVCICKYFSSPLYVTWSFSYFKFDVKCNCSSMILPTYAPMHTWSNNIKMRVNVEVMHSGNGMRNCSTC